MPDSLESGTLNLPGIAGLYAGMRFALALSKRRAKRRLLCAA